MNRNYMPGLDHYLTPPDEPDIPETPDFDAWLETSPFMVSRQLEDELREAYIKTMDSSDDREPDEPEEDSKWYDGH